MVQKGINNIHTKNVFNIKNDDEKNNNQNTEQDNLIREDTENGMHKVRKYAKM